MIWSSFENQRLPCASAKKVTKKVLPTPKNFLRIAEICDLYEVTVKKDFRGRPQHSWDFLQESKRFPKNVTIISTFLEIFNQHFCFFHYSDSADSATYLIFMKVVIWKKKK